MSFINKVWLTKPLRLCPLVAAMSLPLSVDAQKPAAPFLRVGGDISAFGEFEHMYLQNKDAALIPMTESEYVSLFTNYKLKVAEAKSLGLDTIQSYKDECKYYVDELARPYLEDSLALPRFFKREKERLLEEVKAQHVLISVRPNALPADTLAAYNKAVAARERVLAGEDFDKVASECSNDPSAKSNHGDLGYFSALQMVQEFEDVAYAIKPGEVSEVFRTRFGFHFMKVSDRRKTEGQVTVQHIMKVVPSNGADVYADVVAKAKIDSIYALAVSGAADFGELAKDNSDDRQSAMRGGLIPWFSRAQILPEFADAAFALEKDGDISHPVRTRAGWHIIRRVGRRTSMPDSEFEHSMERVAKSMDRLKDAPRMARMAQLAKEYGWAWNPEGRDTLIGRMLMATTSSQRLKELQDSSVQLASIRGRIVTLADFSKYASLWRVDVIPSENLNKMLGGFMTDFEHGMLEAKYPDFAFSKKEYLEGLLVFEVMQRNVWSLTPDSATVDSLFSANRSRYSKGGVFDGNIYFCSSPKVAEKVRRLIAKGKEEKAKSLAYRVVSGPVSQGDMYDDFIWPLLPVSDYVVVSGKVSDGEPLSLEQCRGYVLGDFQRVKEAEFVARLRDKYKPEQLIRIKD